MLVKTHQNTIAYARLLDEEDPLRAYRQAYHIPVHNDHPTIYFCGNSLGLQPQNAAVALEEELQQWREKAVEGWFQGDHPWLRYHAYLQSPMADIVGAHPEEVIVMNTLTVNLHLMLISFYRPDKKRFKIIMESGAFPSDQYALASQVALHGFSPEEALVEVHPRPGEVLLRTEDIIQTIEEHRQETALVLFGGLNYYTGQFYDLAAITRAAHRVGAYAGFDLAHAAGNVQLQLHDWGLDFAVWCTYKYLNSGPGGPSGVFVHQRHAYDHTLPRLAGWWGQKEEERFLMEKQFHPTPGAAGWQISTPQILNLAPLRASLDLFAKAGMQALRAKSERLTDYLWWQLDRLNQPQKPFRILSPEPKTERGCQISIYLERDGKALFEHLTQNGVICDWREDNLFHSGGGVIRIAPTPMYNTFEEIFLFASLLEK